MRQKMIIDPITKKLTIDIELTNLGRTKLQKHVINNMLKIGDFESIIKYTDSFSRRQRMSIDKLQSFNKDLLALKDKNSILRKFNNMINLDECYNHRPVNKKTTWVGVEIECCIPFKSVGLSSESNECEYCDGSGVRSDDDGNEHDCDECSGRGSHSASNESSGRDELRELFRNKKITLTTIKEDGSIRTPDDSYFSCEITVLSNLQDPYNLKKVCNLLNSIGAKVNKSCGMHVHLDARHLTVLDVKAIGRKFSHALPVMSLVVPKTRLNNTYCQPKVSSLTGDRYCAVNLTSFKKHKTIEVRLHSSTTDFNKIIQWSKFISAIMTATKTKPCKTLNELTEYISIDQDCLEYLSQREALFQGETASVGAQDTDSSDRQSQNEAA